MKVKIILFQCLKVRQHFHLYIYVSKIGQQINIYAIILSLPDKELITCLELRLPLIFLKKSVYYSFRSNVFTFDVQNT